jgi:predicted transcriptional regulator
MERHQLFEAALVLALISLVGLLYLAIVSTPPASYSWEAQANGSVDYMFVGSDDTLYAFSGNTITAVGKDGGRLWNLTIAAEWKVLNNWTIQANSDQMEGRVSLYHNYPIASENDGILYVYAVHRPSEEEIKDAWRHFDNWFYSRPCVVFAISHEGTIQWEHLIPGNVSAFSLRRLEYGDDKMLDSPAIRVCDDRVYVFHDYREDVLDSGGRLLFTLDNITAPVAVDEAGRIYAVRGIASPPRPQLYNGNSISRPELALRPEYKYLVPVSLVDAYNPDGSLAWSLDIGINATIIYVPPDLWPQYNSIPLYANHTLYVPVKKGFMAIGTDGRLQWVRQIENRVGHDVQFEWTGEGRTYIITNYSGGDWDEGGPYVPLSIMPIDSRGYAYMAPVYEQWNASAIRVMTPDGKVTSSLNATDIRVLSGSDGIIYSFDSVSSWDLASVLLPPNVTTLNESYPGERLRAGEVAVFDLKSNVRLWNFSISLQNISSMVLNASNIQYALPSYIIDYVRELNEKGSDYSGAPLKDLSLGIGTGSSAEIFPGKDVVYVYYYYCMYEAPVVYNRSRCAYVNVIYALDMNGNLLWEKPVDGIVLKAAAGNGTIYYLTSNGKMGGGTAGVAAGIAIIAAVYVFLRFFLVGAVARARSRIDQNDNRNRAFRYIVDNPGATAVDLSRGLDMNIGTIRYHLFVLSLNHKIVNHKEDGKCLRYFTNSGTYTPEERAVLSLLRRESLRRMLGVLTECPGMTSLELSRRMGVSTTVAHRHINELMGRGVIVKVCGTEKGNVYSINERHRDLILRYLA